MVESSRNAAVNIIPPAAIGPKIVPVRGRAWIRSAGAPTVLPPTVKMRSGRDAVSHHARRDAESLERTDDVATSIPRPRKLVRAVPGQRQFEHRPDARRLAATARRDGGGAVQKLRAPLRLRLVGRDGIGRFRKVRPSQVLLQELQEIRMPLPGVRSWVTSVAAMLRSWVSVVFTERSECMCPGSD